MGIIFVVFPIRWLIFFIYCITIFLDLFQSMTMPFCNFRYFYWIFLLLVLFTSSCVGYKKTLFFQGEQKTVATPDPLIKYKLRIGDIIYIKFLTPDAKSSEMLDIDKAAVAGSPASIYFNNYSIDDSGYVDLPLTGKLYIKGYTIMEVDSIVTEMTKVYFNFSTIDVKLASFKITALGEFKSPGDAMIYNNKCTIFEAIGIAGDLTDVANRTKVKLIRKGEDGQDIIFPLDLTGYEVYSSEAFYVLPNDIIYVQPQKAKVDSKNIQYITFTLATISTVLVFVNLFTK